LFFILLHRKFRKNRPTIRPPPIHPSDFNCCFRLPGRSNIFPCATTGTYVRSTALFSYPKGGIPPPSERLPCHAADALSPTKRRNNLFSPLPSEVSFIAFSTYVLFHLVLSTPSKSLHKFARRIAINFIPHFRPRGPCLPTPHLVLGPPNPYYPLNIIP